ncbi:phage shock protein C (PspC) family protein [Isoptericola sp. CG 20/1183]|uniref:Phage shock protein C (PspC) family protein n=1 Tax=Isoptericola halotolerans TaxID=300560 RepID=A0ABX5EF80_9MICO|nr:MULTISPECIES: PspC domain-containing protein [Isoptericola]PRZ06963.1 phage shock protein C (PspC) family protein [Isoptericola halotolerans]PRZ07365.1 phage shock protein C (PspC) family protein [Isoptericola sp. CG 20/1183]
MTTNDTPGPDTPGGAAGPGGTDGAAAPPPPAPPSRPAGDGFFDSVRRIGVTRSDDRWVGGVAAGIADRFRLDPLLVRGLLILSFFVAGAGLVLYGVAWALLPERSDGRIHLQEAIRGTFDVAMVGAGITTLLGLIWGGGFWPWWGGPAEWVSVLLWIAFWVAVVWLIVKLVRSRSQSPRPVPSSAAPGYPTGAPPSAPFPQETGMSPSEPFTPAPRASYVPAAPPAGGVGATSSTAYAAPPTPPVRPGVPQYAAPPAPPAPSVPPAPPAPRPRRTVGGGTVGAVVGLVLLAGAALLVADRVLDVTLPLWPVWVGTAVVVVGVGIVIGGLRGLRGGWLTVLAWFGIVTAATAWSFASEDDPWPWDEPQVTTMSGTVISQGTVTPRSVAAAEDGIRVQFGEADIDLTQLDLSGVTPGDPVEVPIDMTAGRTVVEIPADTAVEISADVNAGNLVIDVDDQRAVTSGFTGGPADYQTDEVAELGGAVLQLDIDARAGEIVIKEER